MSSNTTSLSKSLKKAGIIDTIEMVTFPLARNKIMIRLENIADIYDNATETTVALKNLTLALYKYANSKNH